MTIRQAITGIVALMTVLAGCAEQTSDDPSPTITTDDQAARLAETCGAAEPNIVQAVKSILADGYSLGPAGAVNHPAGLVLIADIFDGEVQVSSADTWLVDPPRALPLSSSAEDYSTIPRPDGAATIAGQVAALAFPPYAADCRPQ